MSGLMSGIVVHCLPLGIISNSYDAILISLFLRDGRFADASFYTGCSIFRGERVFISRDIIAATTSGVFRVINKAVV